ncbi:hypothetical protein [Lactobacillus sp. PSON]|uniref:hypothetical protein n=1 Tax=Lactobacillus sp. PSON TaxID=3455454 RepID=UPI0040430475
MQKFIDVSIKAVIDNIAEIPKVLFGSKAKKVKKTSHPINYGGFIAEDWKNVGTDMKRGLITFEKSR